MSGKRIDIEGRRFGRWVVLEARPSRINSNGKKQPMWFCSCDCGVEREVRGALLRNGASQSCGCLQIDVATQTAKGMNRSHGRSETRAYSSWCNMKTRCTNPSYVGFVNYGGRGITICERWFHSFENFFADMGERPLRYTLERLNNDGNYEPGNCVWATRKTQRRNARHCRLTADQVREIKIQLAAGLAPIAIARIFEVSNDLISGIGRGTSWLDVTP